MIWLYAVFVTSLLLFGGLLLALAVMQFAAVLKDIWWRGL